MLCSIDVSLPNPFAAPVCTTTRSPCGQELDAGVCEVERADATSAGEVLRVGGSESFGSDWEGPLRHADGQTSYEEEVGAQTFELAAVELAGKSCARPAFRGQRRGVTTGLRRVGVEWVNFAPVWFGEKHNWAEGVAAVARESGGGWPGTGTTGLLKVLRQAAVWGYPDAAKVLCCWGPLGLSDAQKGQWLEANAGRPAVVRAARAIDRSRDLLDDDACERLADGQALATAPPPGGATAQTTPAAAAPPETTATQTTPTTASPTSEPQPPPSSTLSCGFRAGSRLSPFYPTIVTVEYGEGGVGEQTSWPGTKVFGKVADAKAWRNAGWHLLTGQSALAVACKRFLGTAGAAACVADVSPEEVGKEVAVLAFKQPGVRLDAKGFVIYRPASPLACLKALLHTRRYVTTIGLAA